MAQKGTSLHGEGINEEVLASTDSLFDKGAHGVGQKGLQQFFSPEAASTLALKVIGPRVATLDPTAGDGSLLKAFDPGHSFGIEIDKDQIANANGSYINIQADLQQVYPLVKLGTPEWSGIVANPPFGLKWEDPAFFKNKVNSTLLTFMYISRLLAEDGQFLFICGRDRFYRQIADLPEAVGIHSLIECNDLFGEGVVLPTVLAFGIHPGNRAGASNGYVKREVSLDMLDLLGDWVIENREAALGEYNYVRSATRHYDLRDTFNALQAEYNRRVEKRLGKGANREYDAQLKDGKTVQWLPSAFAQLALRRAGDAYTFNGLNGQNVNYFIQDERAWVRMLAHADSNIITIDPRLRTKVDDILGEARKEICPLYQIKPQQRLGYLSDIDNIRCTKDAPDRGFLRGEWYRINTKTETIVTDEDRTVESKKSPGEFELKKFRTQRKVLSITVGKWRFLDGDNKASENIQFLIDHFELPDPGQVSDKHPQEIAALEALAQTVLDEVMIHSRAWEEENPTAVPYQHRPFQKQDIARLLFKGSGLLSWEQGLGKTLGAILFAECCTRLGAKRQHLFVVPNDLMDQWQREYTRFTGKKLTPITPQKKKFWVIGQDGEKTQKMVNDVHVQAHDIAKKLKRGAEGAYITYYEALARSGTNRSRPMPTVIVKEYDEQRLIKGTDRYGYYYCDLSELSDTEKATYSDDRYYGGSYTSDETKEVAYPPQIPIKNYYSDVPEGCEVKSGHIRARYETIRKVITSKEVCPECEADTRNGWNGLFCERELDNGSTCGYAHYEVRVKPMASLLSGAFKKGVVVMDEITMIQGDLAKRSIALRGLTAAHKLGMTGTPIKNFVAQAYWLLWWCLGDGSKRFGYTYEGGRTKFENNFSVIEWVIDKAGKKTGRAALPEVTNLSMLWRLLASSIIRRRKEETGEKLVKKHYHTIKVPLGVAQTEQMSKWMKDFAKFFIEKYPDKPLSKMGPDVVAMWAPMIGLNWKLDYACTVPESDPDKDWTGVEDVSNFTPANLRVIELSMALAKQGRKVLIGSNLIQTSKWIADQLAEKGVKAIHILDESGTTANASARAKRVYSFQTDEVQVFAAGVNAIRLGHNLDAANAVILHGLDWSFDTLDQFVNRVHRMTSRTPIDIFIVQPSLEDQNTITTRKWDILTQKGDAAALALDGRLIEKSEDEVDRRTVINDLVQKGLTVTDDAVDEFTVQEAWEAMPSFEDYEVPEGLIPPTPADDEDDAINEFLAETAEGLPPLDSELDAMKLEQNAVELEEQAEDIPAFTDDDELDTLETAALYAAINAAEGAEVPMGVPIVITEDLEVVAVDTNSLDSAPVGIPESAHDAIQQAFGPADELVAAGVPATDDEDEMTYDEAATAMFGPATSSQATVEPEAVADAAPAPVVDPMAAMLALMQTQTEALAALAAEVAELKKAS